LIGAPALRFAQQEETLHAVSAVTEQTLDYAPSPYALSAIVNATIRACNRLDGREGGVVSRVDSCVLRVKVANLVGIKYKCSA
jgi:tannase